MINPQPGKHIDLHYSPTPKPDTRHSEQEKGCRHPDVRHDDVARMLRLEVRSVARPVEMAALPPRRRCHTRQRKVVDEQVCREGDELVGDEFEERYGGHVFC
jgi:hypothetical protein